MLIAFVQGMVANRGEKRPHATLGTMIIPTFVLCINPLEWPMYPSITGLGHTGCGHAKMENSFLRKNLHRVSKSIIFNEL
jgi:hypothetical protein